MSELDAALRRLDQAVDAAESAIGRALDAADAGRLREQELTTLADDRLRLATLLDESAARAEQVEAAKHEVGRRIDAAIASVEAVLEEAKG